VHLEGFFWPSVESRSRARTMAHYVPGLIKSLQKTTIQKILKIVHVEAQKDFKSLINI
jgi:hypothetical protein